MVRHRDKKKRKGGKPPDRERLPFETFDFEYHFRRNGTFLIEHGIGEGGFSDGTDFSGDSEGDLMDGGKGLIIEEGFLGAGEFEMMEDIVFGFVGSQTGHMVAHGDPLTERLHNSEVHDSAEIGLAAEDKDEGVIGVHFKVGQ